MTLVMVGEQILPSAMGMVSIPIVLNIDCFCQVLVNTRRWCWLETRMLTSAKGMVSIPTVLNIDFYLLVSARF